MKVKDLTALLETYAPLSLQESYDNSGLLCGCTEQEVASVLLCTDITENVIDEAIAGGHNLIVSHHPLTLQGVKNLIPDTYIKKCLIKAVKHGLNLYAAHTNMDAVINGVSGKMADKLGLGQQVILQPQGRLYSLTFFTPRHAAGKVRQAVFDAGAGMIGRYKQCSFNAEGTGTFTPLPGSHPFCGTSGSLHNEPEVRTEITVPEYLLKQSIGALKAAHPYEEPVWNVVCIQNTNPLCGFGIIGELPREEATSDFLKRLKTTFHCGVVRHTTPCRPKIKRVAVCGGSGAFLIQEAIRQKADIYITGDIKYHDFFQAEDRIILADIGHYESEQYTKEIFYELLTKKISKFAVQFSKVETNPIKYL